MIVIVNYGMGNFGSVANMLKKIGANYIISSDIDTIRNAEKLILHGVGAFDTAISRIDEMDLREILLDLAFVKKIPILGICLGMQLLMDSSDEGLLPGLGLIKGKSIKFNFDSKDKLKIPHMGWNDVILNNSSSITNGYQNDIRFYFIHSYFVKVEDDINSIMKCTYGIDFDAAVQNDNIYGAQFHPEKSHRFGIQFFKNFVEI